MGAFIDLTGHRRGKLTVLELHSRAGSSTGATRWLCKCDCGNTSVVKTNALRSKGRGTNSCGCAQREAVKRLGESHFKDLTGRRFGKTVVLALKGGRGKERVWICRCDCGSEHEAIGSVLNAGDKKSCGCLQRESASARMSERHEYLAAERWAEREAAALEVHEAAAD